MKSLRFVILILAILLVYLAQLLFQSTDLSQITPAWLLNISPLRALLFWSPSNLQRLALLLAAVGAILYGLIAQPPSAPADSPRNWSRLPSSPGRTLLLLAALLSVGLLIVYLISPSEPPWTHWIWGISLLLALIGSWPRTVAPTIKDVNSTAPPIAPERGWPIFLLILAGAALLYGWQLNLLPIGVDRQIASHGLQAMRILGGEETRIFAPDPSNLPWLASYPAALGMLISGDWLVGNRLAGLFAGLLTLLGVWLLSCELFRRQPLFDENGLLLQDDGRRTAWMATLFTAIGYTFIHFSRLPFYLEPVAWGTLALWALARGLRTGERFSLLVSGLLLGLTLLLYESGLIFLAVALIWLIGYRWARPYWFRAEDGSAPQWAWINIWLAGVFVFLAPVLGGWLGDPAIFLGRIESFSLFNPDVYPVLGEHLRRAALTFNLYSDTSALFGYDGPMLDPLLAPLLLLGIGVVLLNLDQWLSWQMLSWLAAAILLGVTTGADAPFWPRLLPALPIAGLIIALAEDRWRATLLSIGGSWLQHLGSVIVLGVIIQAAAHNWIGYYENYTVGAEPATYVGRALRTLDPGEIPFLVVGADRPSWNDPVIEYLGATRYRNLPQGELNLDDLPAQMPPRSLVLLLPGDQVLAATLQMRYPDGLYRVQRDRQGNPVLVIYELP